MPHRLSQAKAHELSLIFSDYNGQKWQQRNQDAVVLATKGSPVGDPPGAGQPAAGGSFLDRFATAIKGWFIADDVEVEDNIDGDGDGAEDYERIAWLVISAAGDLQQGFSVSGDTARAALVVATIDTFLSNLDDVRTGGKGEVAKAGARNSKEDRAKLDQIKEHADAIGKLHDELTAEKPSDADANAGDDDAEKAAAVKALGAWMPGDVGEDGLPENYADRAPLVEKAKSDDDKGDKPYGDVEYADDGMQADGKKRYPIDTKAHAKSAWSFINKEKNASKYSAADLKTVKDKIKAACEKFGVEIDDEKKGTPVDGVLTLADGSTIEVRDGAIVSRTEKAATAQPPAASPAASEIDPVALAETIGQTVKAQLEAHGATVKADLGAQLSAVTASLAEVTERVAGIEKGGSDALSANVIALRKAQEATAIGGLGSAADDLSYRPNAAVDAAATPPPPLARDASVRDAIAHARLTQTQA